MARLPSPPDPAVAALLPSLADWETTRRTSALDVFLPAAHRTRLRSSLGDSRSPGVISLHMPHDLATRQFVPASQPGGQPFEATVLLNATLYERERLAAARVIIVVAGMEGALPSVVAGLVNVPVIAVPTSVGYGASFGGVAALLGMLNTCANGVAVVNIDNGFGAGCMASLINHR